MRKILTEISTIDAWNRFYKDKIPEQIFNMIMSDTKKMTPWHKVLLDKFLGIKSQNNETKLNAQIEQLTEICKLWKTLNNEAKQELVRLSSNGAFSKNYYYNLILAMIRRMSEQSGFSENYYAQNGLVKVYESGNLLVTCTLTYSANKQFYGDSHWCTASDIAGNYNGYYMFRRYTNCDDEIDSDVADMCLIQFIDKHHKEENSYQVNFDSEGESYEMCDFYDERVDTNDIICGLHKLGEEYGDILKGINFSMLVSMTDGYRAKEADYWEPRVIERARKLKDEILNDYKAKSKTIEESAIEYCKELINKGKVEKDNRLNYINQTEVDGWNIEIYGERTSDYLSKKNIGIYYFIVVCQNRANAEFVENTIGYNTDRVFSLLRNGEKFTMLPNLQPFGVYGKTIAYCNSENENDIIIAFNVETNEQLNIEGISEFNNILPAQNSCNCSTKFSQFFNVKTNDAFYLVDGFLFKTILKSCCDYQNRPLIDNNGVVTYVDENGKKKTKKLSDSMKFPQAKTLINKIKGHLNEISSADAWNKFYKDKVPRDFYTAIMAGSNKMTPWHKMLLDKYLLIKSDKNIDKEAIDFNARHLVNVAKLWPSLHEEIKQYLIEISAEGKFDRFWPDMIYKKVERLSNQKGFSEGYYSKEGLVVLYESDNLLVTCTLTYSANKKFYGDSHWCTASDIFGEYDGFEMFRKYTNYDDDPSSNIADCCLVQFIDKHNREENSYQVQYTEDGEIGEKFDFLDKETTSAKISLGLEKIGENYLDITRHINFEDLIERTQQYRRVEETYWRRKLYKHFYSLAKRLSNDYEKDKKDIIETFTSQCKRLILQEKNEWREDWETWRLCMSKEGENENFAVFSCSVDLSNYENSRYIQEYAGIDIGKIFTYIFDKRKNNELTIINNKQPLMVIGDIIVIVNKFTEDINNEYYFFDTKDFKFKTIEGVDSAQIVYIGRLANPRASEDLHLLKYFVALLMTNNYTRKYVVVNGDNMKCVATSITMPYVQLNMRTLAYTDENGEKKSLDLVDNSKVNEAVSLMRKLLDY